MTILPFLHVFSTLVYLNLAIYGLIKNPKALTNRIFSLILFCFTIWGICLTFLHNPYTSKTTARFCVDVSAFIWIGFSSFLVLFIMAFTGKTNLLKKGWVDFLLVAVPAILIYQQWTNGLLMDFIPMPYGWKPIYSNTIWPHLFYFYYLSYMAVGFYFNIDFIRKTRDAIKKKQAWIMLVSIAITLALGSITDVFLPLVQIHSIPNLAGSFVLIWAIGVAYAIVKYQFLKITPATAAENILATMFDCLILANPEGTILKVNEATTILLGYTESELKEKPLTKLIKDGGDANHLVKKLMNNETSKNPEFTFLTKTGDEIPVLLSCSTLNDNMGQDVGVVCVASDISERKEFEEERLRRKKLESLGILAGGIAHDFNNLLAVIIGNIGLAKHTLTTGKAHDLLDNAEQVAEIATELAGKFITFSTGGWLKKEKIPVAEFLNSLHLPLPSNQPHLPEKNKTTNISFVTSSAPDVKWLYGDESQLQQVLQSLLINAVESLPLPQIGCITVQVENCSLVETETLPITLKTGKYVKIKVRDNGSGIPKQYLEKIFEPYFSTKNLATQTGNGLGLTICGSIIEKHDGHITVASEKGKGTTVTLYLPSFPG